MSNFNIVQYVIVRRDLFKDLGWPVGAVIAQACHAVTAAIHQYKDDECTQKYLEDIDNMYKIVLEACDEAALQQLTTTLTEHSIQHKLWIEQPENIPTCLALKPYKREDVQKYLKHLKLFKNM